LKNNNNALWNGTYGAPLVELLTSQPDKVFSFSREKDGDKIIAVFNFSSEASEFEFSQAVDISGLQDLFNNGSEEKLSAPSVSMGPWEYIILTSKP